ncbi:MATE family efflux transporter [Mediterraneibacter hominis]|uniref:MATE family efflux transporter n=1 Tax=Mediterraneibacter hominis TaxID=2763054 RepID=UPI002ED17CB1
MGKYKIQTLIYPDRRFYREVALIALPVALQGLITIGVNITDTLMIGMLGERQLSAASLATQYMNMFQSFCMGLSMGISVMASRYWGMQELISMKKTITVMFRCCLLLAAFFTLTTGFIPEQIMWMYTKEEDIIAYGVQYLEYCTYSYIFFGLSLTTTVVLRSMKKVKLSLLTSILSFLLNIAGNYVLMFGKLGFPKMGIAGAALSTLLVRMFEFVVICGYLFCGEKRLNYTVRDFFHKAGDLFPEYIRIGFPVLISDIVLALGNNVVMMIIGRIGAAFVAANAIASVVDRLCNIFIQGVSQGSAVITGNTLGQGRSEEVKQQGWAFLGIGIVLGVLSAVVLLLIKKPVILIYHLTDDTAEITQQLMYAMSLTVVFQSANHILTKGTLRGGGDTKALMVADNLFLWMVAIPLGLVTGIVGKASPFFVYVCLKMDNPIKTLWCVMRLRNGKWIKRIHTAGVQEDTAV